MRPSLPSFRSRRVLVVALAPLAVTAVLATLFLAESGSGRAQQPVSEPAFLTLLNLTPRFQTVDVDRRLADGGSADFERVAVQADQPETIVVDAGAAPEDFSISCLSCRAVDFSVAAGQRLLVLIVGVERSSLRRSDLHVVNESGTRQRGAVRTGANPGAGRKLLPFDLRDGESSRVGLRLRNGAIDLNLTCSGCDPQLIRIGNGVDLEVVIR